jgi:hypothetical protein
MGKYTGQVPELGTDAYDWWSAGSEAEAATRDAQLSPGHKELRDLLDSLSALHGSKVDNSELATTLMRAVAPGRLRLRYRKTPDN